MIMQNQNQQNFTDLRKEVAQSFSRIMRQNSGSTERVQKVLKSMQKQLQTQIQNGNVTINFETAQLSSSIVVEGSQSSKTESKQKPKLKKPFYMASNPQIIRQKYTQFLQLKQQYSHPSNQASTKQMESLMKSWIKRQKMSQVKRQHLINKLQKKQLLLMEKEEQERRKSIEAKLEKYRQDLVDKIELRKFKKNKEEKLMKSDSISKQMLKQQKQPLFKEKQRQFQQKQRLQQQSKNMQLYWRKQSLAPYDTAFLKQHRIKASEELKKQSKQRSQTSNSPRKLKTQTSLHLINTRSEFITTKNDRLATQQEEQKKRFRIREYVQRLKSMSPDQSTLERIKKVKEDILSNQKLMQENKLKRIQTTSNLVKKRAASVKTLPKKHSQDLEGKQDRIRMGNQYIQEQKRYAKIKTQQKNNHTIEENPEEFSFEHEKTKQSQDQSKKYTKAKTQNTSQIKQNEKTPKKKTSLKRINPSSSAKILNNPSILPLKVETRPQYKNYLPEVKSKLITAKSEVDKAKRLLKYPEEIFRQFGKRSFELEKKLMRKINEFKKIQSTQKYEKNLLKQREIDQLYHKNLQMKLACLSIE